MREDIIRKIDQEKLIAIVRGIAPEKCVRFADAIYEGGFRLMEITFNLKDPSSWQQTADAIKACCDKYEGRMDFGAGTVVSTELAEMAAAGGAKFIVSPDTNPAVIKRTVELGMVSLPGALTPSEVLTAHFAGADFVKLFPITKNDIGYLKNVTSPLSHIPFICTGGVDPETIPLFFEAGVSGVGTGASIFRPDLVRTLDLPAVTALAQRHVAAVRAARG